MEIERYHRNKARLDGYLSAVKSAHIAPAPELICTSLFRPVASAGAGGLEAIWSRTQDFTAVVCFNDLMAMGVVEALRAKGKRVPEDVSVTGFDDVSEHYQFEPKLTSIAFNRYEMGRRAVEIICAAQHESAFTCFDEVFSVELVVRNTTAPMTK